MREITKLEELKTIQLEILRKLHSFCEAKNLRYYLAYGTLIGAVRHSGFIPWDDDIDITMPREDYNRFCKEFPSYGEQCNLEVVNANTPTYYGRTMSKVIDTRTVLIETEYQGDDDLGVFVDIWPMDGVPEGKVQRLIHVGKCDILKKLLYGKIRKKEYLRGWLHKTRYYLCLPLSREWIVRKLERLVSKFPYKDTTYSTCHAAIGSFVYVDTQLFEETIMMKFEDEMFIVPKEYDKILRIWYGEYMKFPPVEERVAYHQAKVYWK